MVINVLVFCGIAVLSIYLRRWPYHISPYVGVDSYYHLLTARRIRELGHRLPRDLSDSFTCSGSLTYPPLLSWMFSLLPEAPMEHASRWFAAVVDTATGAGTALFVIWVTGKPWAGLLTFVAYALTPRAVFDSNTFTPRPFANLLLAGALFTLIAGATHAYLTLAVSALLLAAMFSTHKLTSQFFALSLLPLTLALPSVIPATLLGVLVVLAIRGRGIIEQWLDHVRVVAFHFRHGDFRGIRAYMSPVKSLKQIPWLAVLAGLGAYRLVHAAGVSRFDAPLLAWTFTGILLASLWRYGDGYRYLDSVVAPVAALVGIWASGLGVAVAALAGAGAVILCLLAIRFLYASGTGVTDPDLVAVSTWLRAQPGHGPVLALNPGDNYAIAYLSRKQVIGGDASAKGLAYNLGILQPALTAEALTAFIEEVKPQYIVVPAAASLQTVDHIVRQLYSHGAYAVFG
ncbi:MAG: hypothetical protein ACYC5Y_01020 [Symbiobacteriia bacterium]